MRGLAPICSLPGVVGRRVPVIGATGEMGPWRRVCVGGWSGSGREWSQLGNFMGLWRYVTSRESYGANLGGYRTGMQIQHIVKEYFYQYLESFIADFNDLFILYIMKKGSYNTMNQENKMVRNASSA